jgi:hypothetical protein
MYHNKKRENRYFSYIFNPLSTTQTLDGNDIEDFAGQDWGDKDAACSGFTAHYPTPFLLPFFRHPVGFFSSSRVFLRAANKCKRHSKHIKINNFSRLAPSKEITVLVGTYAFMR